jgi:hypothetical protein
MDEWNFMTYILSSNVHCSFQCTALLGSIRAYYLVHYFRVFLYFNSSIHNSLQEFHSSLYFALVGHLFHKTSQNEINWSGVQKSCQPRYWPSISMTLIQLTSQPKCGGPPSWWKTILSHVSWDLASIKWAINS